MDEFLKKLNFKENIKVLLLDLPESMRHLKAKFEAVSEVSETAADKEEFGFALSFVYNETEVEAAMRTLSVCMKTDGIIWFAYIKKSSPLYAGGIDRDHGWVPAGRMGYEPVRQVALDEDYSALRFKKTADISKLSRSGNMALSDEAKARISLLPESIDGYLSQFDGEFRKRLDMLRQTIREAAPEASEKISYGMPTYFLNGNLVHFAAQKEHTGFYPAPEGIEKFSDELKEYATSKGAIRFPHNKPIPFGLVARIVKFRVEQNTLKGRKKG